VANPARGSASQAGEKKMKNFFYRGIKAILPGI
jgi:hypothetical protein